MKHKSHKEGDWFAVPLANGQFAVGIVARKAPRGGVTFGYFFGPVRDAPPNLEVLRTLNFKQAELYALLGALGLIEGTWPVIGSQGEWKRQDWPMGSFVRHARGGWKIVYSDENPEDVIEEVPATPQELKTLPERGLCGAGAIEALLSARLCGPPVPSYSGDADQGDLTYRDMLEREGFFDSDDGADWAGELLAHSGLSFLRRSLAVDGGDDHYLEAPEGARILCSAEVLAALSGRPADDLPDGVESWVRMNMNLVPDELKELGRQGVDRVLDEHSELNELYSENEEGYPAWRRQVEDLRRRLE